MFTLLILFLLGLSGASFATCFADRLLAGETMVKPPRSYCPNCHHVLSWWQVVPLFGWLIQGGKCHYCRAKISPWSTLVELYCGLSLALLWQAEVHKWVAGLIVFSTLDFLSTTDHQQKVIYPVAIIGLAPLLVLLPWCFPQSIATCAICLFYAILLLGLNRWHHSIGFGDCEILILLLFLTGPVIGTLMIFFSSLLALVQTLFHRQAVPFVPAISLVLVLFCDAVSLYPALLAPVWATAAAF